MRSKSPNTICGKRIALIYLYFILASGIPQNTQAQAYVEEIKATLIIHFCDNVEWSKNFDGEITIGCYSDDQRVFEVLELAREKVNLQGKQFRVKKVKTNEDILTCNALYYDRSDVRDLVDIFELARENNILLITDNYPDQLFVMINIIESGSTVAFKVNMSNLTLAGFSVKPNLLLNGGSVVDIKKAFEKFEEQLRDSYEKLERSRKELAESEIQLKQKDDIIRKKESEIEDYIHRLESFKNESETLKKLIREEQDHLKEQENELERKDEELQLIYADIKERQNELLLLRRNIEALRKESDTLKYEIDQKNVVVHQQEQYISNQQKLLYISLAFIAALVLAGFALTRLFFIKKKHNKELGDKVNARTKALTLKNEQYMSLFNMAPVAIWEIDFSDVKEYINEIHLKEADDYDAYISEHPDFAATCFGKMKFINVNSTSLELFKVKNLKELLDLYEGSLLSGSYEGLAIEFKPLFLNKKTHYYEAVRYNKYHERLDVLIKWIDISEDPGTYTRVLFTLVDVTHLRKIESELRAHQENLELLVQARTDEIGALNKELQSQNEELTATNEALEKANEELRIINNELNEQRMKLNKALEDLKNAQLQMIQSEKMASLGVLTAGVAHEINNPLNFIQTGIYALEENIDENKINPDLLESLQLITKNMKVGVKRASAIVKSLNTFSRRDTDVIKECDIHQIIENSLLILNHELKNKCIVSKNYTGENFVLKGNEESLHQVFFNVLMNAVQAIHSKGELNITTALKDTQTLEVIISDNGRGISKENLVKIFDPFFTTKEPGKGVGLGLSIVYNIVAEHKGTITYDSELEKGTKVSIHLPVSKK